jgi:DNA-binding XRE family transcriptional regulator
MDRTEFIAICDSEVKLVRVEHGFSQEKMASVLGLSKKTLVEIEKGRRTLGWMGSVVLCTIFANSEVLSGVFGGSPTDIILALAFEGRQLNYPKMTGMRIWWSVLMENEYYVIQQNILSQHYRLLDKEGQRIASSFDIDDLLPIFQGIR